MKHNSSWWEEQSGSVAVLQHTQPDAMLWACRPKKCFVGVQHNKVGKPDSYFAGISITIDTTPILSSTYVVLALGGWLSGLSAPDSQHHKLPKLELK